MLEPSLPWGGEGLWHNGSNTMNYASMTIDPKNHRVVVAFTNAMENGLDRKIETCARALGAKVFATAD
jgi:hypothetical protein